MESLTIEALRSLRPVKSVYDTIEYAKTFYKPYPEFLIKPKLPKSSDNSNIFEKYAKDLKEYESKKVGFFRIKDSVRNYNNSIDNIIEDFIKIESGFMDLPEKVKERVWAKAYADGHSSGFYGIYQELEELVNLFM